MRKWGGDRAIVHERLALFTVLPLAGPRALLAMVAVELTAAVVPACAAIATGYAVAHVSSLGSGGAAAVSTIAGALGLLAALLVIDQASGTLLAPLSNLVARRINMRVRGEVRAATSGPAGIRHLEEQSFRDDAVLAGEEFTGRRTLSSIGTGASGQLHLLFRFLGGAVSAAVVATFSPILAAGVFAAHVLCRASLRRNWVGLAKLRVDLAPLRRRADYWSEIIGTAVAAKESRLFGFGSWAVARRRRAILDWHEPEWRVVERALTRQWVVVVLGLLSTAAAFWLIASSAFRGEIGLGEAARTFGAVIAVSNIGYMGYEAYDIENARQYTAALGRLREQLAALPAASAPTTDISPVDRSSVIRFENVWFTYPGSTQPVLKGLDLEIRGGQSLALVGVNGAGKTTVVRLLAGLYEPDRGRISIDGVDLAGANLAAWRRQLAIIFQDFVKYELSLHDNIALGAPHRRHDRNAVQRAAAQAHVDELAATLPKGWETPLSRGFANGTDLSGGQWQRVALARMLFAVSGGSRVLVLDEPTANLDVRAELALFEELLHATAGLTTLLLSHRFSTVRRADRIAVLADGRVVEHGTHDELLGRRGDYAAMFSLQASRFRDGDDAAGAT